MELDQLKVFLTVAETGTFSRAAIRLALTQPVLSRKVKALEEELGTDLFHRTGRGVVLSEAGKMLEQYARGILDTAAGATKAIRALGAAPVGHVTIGMPSSIATVLAVELVQDFRFRAHRLFGFAKRDFSGGAAGPPQRRSCGG